MLGYIGFAGWTHWDMSRTVYQRWPNRVADLLCSLKRKVGVPCEADTASETIKAKALGDVAHFIKSILSFTTTMTVYL